MKKLIFLVFIFARFFATAQNKEYDFEKTAIKSSTYWLDIDYAGDGIVGHRLDVHLPANGQGPFPIIMAVYGSAWFSNSSKANTFRDGLGQALLNHGFAVVSINHRSSSDAKFPAQIQDVKAAIRFIRANAAKFNMDSSFIGITGWSSGGHLAALTGTTNNIKKFRIESLETDIEGSQGKYTATSSHVNAVVDWFGPTDFLVMDKCGSSFSHNDAKSPESSLIGGAIQDNPVKCALANPVNYVIAHAPPFLIFHGNKDLTVPFCQSEKLFEKLQKEKVESQFIRIAEGEHGPGVLIDTNYERMIFFFKRIMTSGKKVTN